MLRNKVMLIGRLGRDPELKTTTSGKEVCKFAIAVQGIKKEDTDWINCEAWEKTAENIAKFFKKGNRIGIEGRLRTNEYTNDENKKVKTVFVSVENFEFIESKSSEGESAPRESAPPANSSAGSYDDDIPF